MDGSFQEVNIILMDIINLFTELLTVVATDLPSMIILLLVFMNEIRSTTSYSLMADFIILMEFYLSLVALFALKC